MLQVLKSIADLVIGFIQLTIYGINWLIGFSCAIVACIMGYCATFSEPTRIYYSEHFYSSAAVFMGVNLGAMATLLLKRHLQKRWEHLGL